MKKHKICILGDGLSGLITAEVLGKLDVNIDLISKKIQKKTTDNRTTAISPNNHKFISKFLSSKKRESYCLEKSESIKLELSNIREEKT